MTTDRLASNGISYEQRTLQMRTFLQDPSKLTAYFHKVSPEFQDRVCGHIEEYISELGDAKAETSESKIFAATAWGLIAGRVEDLTRRGKAKKVSLTSNGRTSEKGKGRTSEKGKGRTLEQKFAAIYSLAQKSKSKSEAEGVHGVANSALNGVHNRGTALDSPLTSSQERRGAVRGEMLPRHLLSALDAAESEPEAAISTAPARAARAATEARAVAVALMQAVSRGRAQRAAPARRAARAAALMQAVSKGYLQRAPARAEARRVRAATLMQAVSRGHAQRAAPARRAARAATNLQFRWRVITTVALFAIAGLAFVCYSERCQGFRDGLRDRVVNLSHKWIGKIGNI